MENEPDPCYFPMLDGGEPKTGATTVYETSHVDEEKLPDIARFCSENGTNTYTFFKVVWSLILNQFTEMDLLYFGVNMSTFGSTTNATSNGFLENAMNVHEVLVNPEKTRLRDLFESINALFDDHNRRFTPKFNSGIFFSHGNVNQDDLATSMEARDVDGQNYAILMIVQNCDGRPDLLLQYDTSVLSSGQAINLGGTIIHVMRCLLEGMEQTVQDIDLVSPENKRDILRWNGQVPTDMKRTSVLDIFHDRCLAQPMDLAVSSWDMDLTYSKLDSLSSKLAQHLSSIGVRPEVMVPICFEKSGWAIVSIFAILKAGGAFVPLDPTIPFQRLVNIVEQVNGRIILASSQQTQLLVPMDGVMTISEETVSSLPDLTSKEAATPISLNQLAYVLFTSGSTGKPKGCAVEHKAMRDMACHGQTMQMKTTSRVLQFASYSFGVSLIEIFCTLTIGATICIPSDHDRLNRLMETINAMDISWAIITPAVVNYITPGAIPCLKTLVLAGEPPSTSHITIWADFVQLVIAYGFTEWSGICCVQADVIRGSNPGNIGVSPTATFWLVDPNEYNKLAPIGAVAELMVEGPSLARGYLNDRKRTEMSFISSPTWSKPFRPKGMTLYKTGDLVRYSSDGSINYVGRKDTQVKIRGQRVEIGEIEYHLREAFRNTKVIVEVVVPANAKVPVLAAFILSAEPKADGTVIDNASDEFRSEVADAKPNIQASLPTYMAPSIYIPLASVPLTVSGKNDRRRLREWATTQTRQELESYGTAHIKKVHPRTEMEKTIHRLFVRLLSLGPESVGIDDSFLQLGGDSISAMKLVSECRAEGIDLTIQDIFQKKTIANLSRSIIPRLTGDFKPAELSQLSKTEKTSLEITPVPYDQAAKDILAHRLAVIGISYQTDVEEVYPCSAIQHGMLVSQARYAGNYQIQFVWKVVANTPQPVVLGKLQHAWQEVIEHQPMLRTIFLEGITEESSYVQVVLKSRLAGTSVVQTLQENAWPPTNIPTTTGKGSLPCLTLRADYNGEVQCSLTISHVLIDATSIAILMRDLGRAYDGQVLPDCNLSYRDYVSYLHSLPSNSDLEYWKVYLADCTTCLFPQLNVESDQHGEPREFQTVTLQLENSSQFYQFCENTGITLANIFHAAWGLVLKSYTGMEDVSFGYLTAGRGVEVHGIDDAIGPFINMLICRIKTSKHLSLIELLEQIQADCIAGISHEHFSLTELFHDMKLSDDGLFNTTMSFPPEISQMQSNRPTIEFQQITRHGPTEYKLAVEVNVVNKALGFSISYWTPTISNEQGRRIASTFLQVLSDIVKSPNQKIWNWNIKRPQRVNNCSHDIIHQRCREQPNAPAICAWDGDLTYQELDELSSQLAVHLMRMSVGPEVFVPICCEKSLWTIVAILGVMKSGGAFVLLDPSHPIKRIYEICATVKAAVIVTSAQQAPSFSSLNIAVSLEVVVVGESYQPWETSDEQWRESSASPNNPIYAIFTSGTTGKSKGAVIEHSSFSSAASAQIDMMLLNKESRLFQFAAYAFDVSIADILLTLLAGGCICVPSESERGNITEALNKYRANVVHLTPSLARILTPQDFPTLQILILGGECMGAADVSLWSPHVELINSYGSAETSITATTQSKDILQRDSRNIGRGVGAVTWIIDDHESLVPIGAVGELLIEGPIVGRGYLGSDPVPSPFIEQPAWLRSLRQTSTDNEDCKNLYKSGDLVQYSPDGSLRYLGRKDTQVKIRGQRLELGEVEHHLRNSLGSSNVAAEVVESIYEDRPSTLVAFIKLDGESISEDGNREANINGLFIAPNEYFLSAVEITKSHLYDSLPIYMVPDVFLQVSYIPLGPTGKMDRRQLREKAGSLSSGEWHKLNLPSTEKQMPSTNEETVLQRLFAFVLSISQDTVGVNDSFFRLGGDSLVAMKLVSVARREGLNISLADIFSNPKISDLVILSNPPKGDNVSITPFSLLAEHLVQESIREAAEQCNIHYDEVEDLYPSTALQEGLIALTMKTKGTYTANFIFQLHDNVNVENFKAAWQVTVATNAILRTRIIQTDSLSLFQAVTRAGIPINWTSHNSLDIYLASYGENPMVLGNPLARFALIKDDNNVPPKFVLTLHHSLYDGVSLGLIFKQIEDVYRGIQIQNWPFNSFVDYILHSKGPELNCFWRSQFIGCHAEVFPALPSPTYIPNAKSSFEHTILDIHSSKTDHTPSTFIRLAWAMVVAHHTDADDVVFGVTFSGREVPVEDIDKITGPTITTVPFRISIDTQQTVHAVLTAVQHQSTTMIPFSQAGLQYISRLSDEAAAACDFQTFLVIQAPRESLGPSLMTELRDTTDDYRLFSSYALVVICSPTSDGTIVVTVNFDPDIIVKEEIQRLLQQFEFILRQLYESPQETIVHIGMCSPEDVHQLEVWNTALPPSNEKCLHEMVLGSCATQPEAPAISSWDGNLTYSELDKLSYQLAQHLIEFGVAPKALVPLCFDRSKWMIVAMLAVLRAGGACVCIAPEFPRDRVHRMIEEAGAELILCSPSNIELVRHNATIIAISSDTISSLSTRSSVDLPIVRPHHPAFVIFTSGSTGKPKAIVLEHISLSTNLQHHNKAVNTPSASRVLHFSSYAFDAIIWEVFGTLIRGNCVCVPSSFDRMNDLCGFIQRHQINVAFFTPSMLRLLQPEDVSHLHTIVLGGEAVTQDLVDTWAGKLNLINGYGPAEASVFCALGRIPESGWRLGTIGHCVAGRAWITTPRDPSKLSAIGAVGELLLEGPGLARGYLNEPELTASSFIESPLWLQRFLPKGQKHGRLYRTGDLMQYNRDGSLRWIGRKDTQVKLRGQRIELAEVEHRISQCFEGLLEVVAEIVVPTEERAPFLAAFLLFRANADSNTKNSTYGPEKLFLPPSEAFISEKSAVESRLYQELPAFMVPSIFILVSHVPMGKTNKINRQELRRVAGTMSVTELEKYSSATKEEKRKPSTKAETDLQMIWARVLKTELANIGADDSFFRLGGDSILAMKLSGLGRKYGLEVSVAEIFEHPQLSDMSLCIRYIHHHEVENIHPFALLDGSMQQSIFRTAAKQCRIEEYLIDDIYPCTALQEGLTALTARKFNAYIANFAYQLPSNVDLTRLKDAWETIAQANVILRTRIIQTESGSVVQCVVRGKIHWKIYKDSESYDADRQNITMTPGEPLLRLSIIQAATKCHRNALVITLHHAIYDAWSLALVLDQVEALYGNNQISIPACPFSPFIAYTSKLKSTEGDFWRSELAGLTATAVYPLVAAGYTPTPDASLSLTIPISPKCNDDFTASTKFRLAWAIVQSMFADSNDVVFGTVVNGRGAAVPHILQMTGPTIATIPSRHRLEFDDTIAKALDDVRKTSTSTIPYEQTGLQTISGFGEGATVACQFQTLLVVQGDQPTTERYADGASCNLFQEPGVSEIDEAFATYALTLWLQPSLGTVQVRFDKNIICEAEILRMLRYFSHVSSFIDNNREHLLRDIPLGPDDHELLSLWNKAVPQRMDYLVHDLISHRCLSQPEAPAVCAWDGEFTYRDVDVLSSQLAIHLISLGAGPEIVVPVYIEKSRWTTIAIVAVLKSGSGFLLLDPQHPQQRLKEMCQAASAFMIISSTQQGTRAAQLVPNVVIAEQAETYFHSHDYNATIATSLNPSNIAYVVFTSGTTGKPKGIVTEHAAFCSSSLPHAKSVLLNEKSRVFQFASYAFDVSIADHLNTLIFGGCICVPSEKDRLNDIVRAANTLQVNWADMTPSVARLMSPTDLPTLETLVLDGEPITLSDRESWATHVNLVMSYGPAECAIKSSSVSLNPDSDPRNLGFGIGCSYWVVDPNDHLKLLPVGAVGELVIEGHIVGRGYLGDLNRTAAAFIDNPLWLLQFRPGGGRIYKTGDLVKYTADGSISFVRRKDTQVKLRGQRIELTEIEHQIRKSFPGAITVVVERIIPLEEERQPYLAAFISQAAIGARDSRGIEHGDLSVNLSDDFRAAVLATQVDMLDNVPAYMVPAVFIPLAYIPLTTNGKSDRRRLQDFAKQISRTDFELYTALPQEKCMPSTELELTLQNIWAQIFQIESSSIGVNDHFFRLGGDSLSAMKHARLCREKGLDISVADIFRNPILSDLSSSIPRNIDSAGMDDNSTMVVPQFSLLRKDLDLGAVLQATADQCGVDLDQIEDIYPCTALQEGLLALTSKSPGSYTANLVFQLPAAVDLQLFKSSWEKVIEANTILRTRLVQSGSERILQCVLRGNVTWETYKTHREYEAKVKAIPMGLGLPLLRLAIIGPDQFALTIHHALYDGWSLPLIMDQVENVYLGASARQSIFSPFIAHLSHLESASAEFWLSELAHSSNVQFPALGSPDNTPTPTSLLKYNLSPIISNKRDDFSASINFQLAWAVVLSQYTSSNDVVFGMLVNGRYAQVQGIEHMTGPTLATIPVRVQLEEQQTNTITAALQHIQDRSIARIPFEQIGLQNIAALGEEAASAVRFQNLLIIQSPEDTKDQYLFQEMGETHHTGTFTTYALTLVCDPSSGVVEATFDSQVICENEVSRVLYQFDYILQRLAKDRTLHLSDVYQINPQDSSQLQTWNSEVPRRIKSCVHDLVYDRYISQPESQAICAWDGNYTYRQLHDLSSALASYLTALGVGPEVFVPVYLEKSRWVIVAILAILKAGGCFVLLDISHPIKRLQRICQVIEAKVLVTAIQNTALAKDLAPTIALVPDLEGAWSNSQTNDCSIPSPASPDNAVYAVFTSGSTGTPKCVVIDHSAYCTSAASYIKASGLTNDSRVLQTASHAFDTSICQILSTLIAGGCICVPSETDRKSNIPKAINDLNVNWADITPSEAKILNPEELPKLETMVLGGESMTPDDITQWAHIRLVQSYGPAECSVRCLVQSSMNYCNDSRNIGRSSGCATWIVNRHDPQKLVPIGSIGELVIEGPTVGRGYLNDPKKTAAVFLHTPRWLKRFRHDESRVYKTGDLVQYLPDGSIKYIGRKDSQIKLRGQRIEIGELEDHSRSCYHGARGIAVALVSPKDGRPPLLIAFVWVDKTLPMATGDLFLHPSPSFLLEVAKAESRLYDIVPSYMVPKFISIAKMPLGVTGKVDRHRLQESAAKLTREELQAYTDAPRQEKCLPSTEAEVALQLILARVLNMEATHIGMDDSFFRLGGDSITAMQVSSRARASELFLTVPEIFKFKTIRQLLANANTNQTSPINYDEELDTHFSLSPIQKFFCHSAGKEYNHYNQSFLIRVLTQITAPALISALKVIVSHHSMLRARFTQLSDGQWSQTAMTNAVGSYRFHEYTLPSLEHAHKVMNASQRSLDIKDGPIFSVDMITINGSEQYLFMVVHHLAIDLVSWRIILGDLEDLLRGDTISLEPSLPFQTWCRLQAEYAQSNLAPEQAFPFIIPPCPENYWGIDNHQNNYCHNLQRNFSVDEETSKLLLGAANDALKTQPVEILQAALLYSFVETFKDREVPTIFSEGHGREPWNATVNPARTVGWFTTIWPTVISGWKQKSIEDAVRRTKDARRNTPSNGWAYFTSRMLNPRGEDAFGTHHPIEITFNYAGLYQQFEHSGALFQLMNGIDTQDIGDDMRRTSVIDVSAVVVRGQVHFRFNYNQQMKHQEKIIAWIDNCRLSLDEAAKQLVRAKPSLTLCDLPLLPMTYDGLDRFTSTTLRAIGIDPAEVEDVYPCVPIQQGMLQSQQRDALYYQIRSTWIARSPIASQAIDVGKLKEAWQVVVGRHSILRTHLVESVCVEGHFDQIVLKAMPAYVRNLKCNKSGALEFLSNHRESFTGKFKPPHQLTLCGTPTGEVFCELEISHALVDALSMQVLMKDLQLAYSNELSPAKGPLYSSYVSYLKDLPRDSTTSYWDEYLAGAKPCLLPSMLNGKSPLIDGAKTLKSTMISLSEGCQLSKWCADHEVTASNIFQLAWGLVLRAYTDSNHICFGYLANGRDIPLKGMEDAIGPYINMLVYRMKLVDGAQVLQTLRKSQADYLEGLSHQHFSLGETLQSADSTTRQLFNTVVSLQSISAPPIDDSTITFEMLEDDAADPTEFDVTLNIAIHDGSAVACLRYWTSAISEEQASRIAETLNQAVSEIIAKPYETLGQLDMLSHGDRAAIETWNMNLPPRVHRCVHEIFQDRCIIQPELPAVCAWDGNFTYNELNMASSALASHLISIGVGPEMFVPIYFEKSRWTPVAILGVIKAGAAFILLNLDHPLERLRLICKSVGAKVILCSMQNTTLAADLEVNFVSVHSTAEYFHGSVSNSPPAALSPNSLLYAVFTSGTTGQPKSIVIEHAAFCSGAEGHGKAFHLSETSRVLQFTSHGFDMSIADYLSTLIYGGCICIPSESDRRERLAESALALNANTVMLTPSLARVLSPADFPSLRVMVTGGEPLLQSDIQRWAGHVKLINSYGPAECSVYSHAHPVANTPDQENIHVGRGVACVGWIVSPEDHHKLLPIGAVGELLIDGYIVGRGYLNDPKETARVFIDAPSWLSQFHDDHGHRRFYKTGDLVQYTGDGSLRCIGRKDNQIKLRGQRIGLGEVEHNLRAFFVGARDVVAELVEADDNVDRPPILAAFVQLGESKYEKSTGKQVIGINGGTTPADEGHIIAHSQTFAAPAEAFRSRAVEAELKLHDVVPNYMVPSVFIQVVQMPLTMNGKTDRRQLRKLVASLSKEELLVYSGSRKDKRMPSPDMEVEAKLQQLWAQVLNLPLEAIGLDDNFIRLGGDSISAMRFAAIARKDGVNLSVASILGQTTLVDLASKTRLLLGNDEPIQKQPPCWSLGITNPKTFIRDVISPCIAMEDFSVVDVLRTTEFQRPFIKNQRCTYFLVDIPGRLDENRLKGACQALIEKHDILRTVFLPYGDSFVQVVIRHIDISIPILETDHDPVIFSESICRKDSETGVPFGTPSFQPTIVSQHKSRHVLILRLSHAQYDGVSMPVLYQDIVAAYLGKTITPAVADFSTYINSRLKEQPAASYRFWREFLQGSSMTYLDGLSLSAADTNNHPATETRISREIQLPIPPPGITIATLFKGAWSFVLASLKSQSDVVFGQVVNGRSIPMDGVEQVIGPCVNIIPVRVTIDPAWTALDLLCHVQDQHSRTVPFETLDLQDIVANCTPWPQTTRLGSIAQCQNIDSDPNLSIDGLKCTTTAAAFPTEVTEDFYIVASPMSDRLVIDISVSSKMMSIKSAETIIEMVSETISKFSSKPGDRLSLLGNLTAREPYCNAAS